MAKVNISNNSSSGNLCTSASGRAAPAPDSWLAVSGAGGGKVANESSLIRRFLDKEPDDELMTRT